jgi:hypothetical protein
MFAIDLMEIAGEQGMASRESEIRNALDAIRKVSDSDLTISRAAIADIERLVGIIDSLADNPEVRREGQYLVLRALGRFSSTPGSGAEASSVVWSARLHGAVARYEFALRRAGLLAVQDGEFPPEAPMPPHPG